ncbi:extracellular solute-binding protein [Martelella sp. HB161492]|uniref:extracellular solute-binding protein n=1 Tax=Martelella sp. HB161492 TaxID=2720726 RepID=UPI001591BC4B|nr:extracellular solute-binding protein [Martelella sp. HB161492]
MWKRALAGTGVLLCCLVATGSVRAEDESPWRTAVALVGDPLYPDGFDHFAYVNAKAPKGGTVTLPAIGTFDSLNPVPDSGVKASGLGLVFETLMTSSPDEISTEYGLLAEALRYPDDYSQVTYRLRPEARFSDGTPVTPEDVVFSFNALKADNVQQANYYRHVTSAEVTGDHEVTFHFDEKGNRELPQITGQLLVFPKHWWEANGADGKPRDISKTTLSVPIGSGPYVIDSVDPGGSITYRLRDDYWGKDLPVNVGRSNFGTIKYLYFADPDVAFEAFRSGVLDFWTETRSKRWATQYDFPAVSEGKVKREEVQNPLRSVGIMQALVPNMRRAPFDDQRVREALILAFDFETINRTALSNAYARDDSFFFGTELASSGLPEGEELDILNSVKDQIPASVFDTPNTLPVGGSEDNERKNLMAALKLLKEAGFERKGTQMINTSTGKPFTFEILISNPGLDVVLLPYTEELRKIGITATIRVVDDSQYQNRVNDFDYDMIWNVWGQSLSPGNEQLYYWGSKAADQPGSQNYAGISDPGIDQLINRVIFAKDRDELVAASKALDRVLLAHDYVIPLYYSKNYRIAYWDRITHPTLPEYGLDFPDSWWSTDVAQ